MPIIRLCQTKSKCPGSHPAPSSDLWYQWRKHMSQVICTVILLIKYCQLVTVFNLLLYLLLLVITTAKCIIKDLRLTPLVHYKGQKGSRQSWVLSNKILKFPYQFSFQLKNFRYKRRPMDSSRPSTLEYNETSILLNDSRSIYLDNSLQAKLVNGMNLQPLIDQCLMQIYYQGSNRNLNSHVTSFSCFKLLARFTYIYIPGIQ